MRKVILVVLATVFTHAVTIAQSYLVTDTALNQAALCCYTVNLPDSVQSHLCFKVKNISASSKHTRVHRHVISQTSGHDISFDFNNTMYAPFTNYSTTVNLAAGQELPVNGTNFGFTAEWWPNGYTGTSIVQYTIYDTSNVSDSIGIRITYNAIPTNVPEIAANEAWNIYPNPATNSLFIWLPIGNAQELTITNPVGEIIRCEKLQWGKNTLNISHFEEGIYFLRCGNEERAKRLVILK